MPERKLAGASSDGIGVNIGILAELNRRFKIGAGVINRTVKSLDFGGGPEPLPTEMRAGAAWKYLSAGPIVSSLFLDIGTSLTSEPPRATGIEFVFDKNLFIRVGVNSKAENDYRLGLGWAIGRMIVDYAIEFHPAGSVQSFGLSYKWGKS